jgi:hypothetical protein
MTGITDVWISWLQHKAHESQWLERNTLGSRDCNKYLDHVTETQIARYPVILYEPSRWRRVLLDKLIVPKLVEKYTTFLRAKVRCHIHNSRLRDNIPNFILFLEELFYIIFSRTVPKFANYFFKDTASHNRRPKSSTCVISNLKTQFVPRSKHFSSLL